MAVGKNRKRKRKIRPDSSGAAFVAEREAAALSCLPA